MVHSRRFAAGVTIPDTQLIADDIPNVIEELTYLSDDE